MKWLVHLVLFAGLTAITQVGGLIYVIYLLIVHFGNFQKLTPFHKVAIYLNLYMLCVFTVVPFAAKQSGRVPLPLSETDGLAPVNPIYCILNRHYVVPEMRTEIQSVAKEFSETHPGAKVLYLDAGFPFMDGFPLLPHLSHNDGRKLDLAFVYRNTDRKLVNETPTMFGYGSFEEPQGEEVNTASKCAAEGNQFYSFAGKFAWFPKSHKADGKMTASLITEITSRPAFTKVFIEPHLKSRWGLQNDNKVRFHGCHAVRHDDHIHVEM